MKKKLAGSVIFAVTFTNKATVEMKERILQLLKEIAFDGFRNTTSIMLS